MSTLITGAEGQLGFELRKLASRLPGPVFLKDMDLDITCPASLEAFFRQHPIRYVINAAAYTAVDRAEQEVELAHAINGAGVGNLAECAQTFGFKLIHISSDFVFDGQHHQPYQEDHVTRPLSAYGRSKLLGELLILDRQIPAAIIRTSWLYSSHGHNFVKTMLRLARERDTLSVVYDQVGCPTHAADLASAIIHILEQDQAHDTITHPEILHYSNEGVASWYDLAHAAIQRANLSCQVIPIRTHDYPTPAIRPAFSVLAKEKVKSRFGLHIPHWIHGLERCLTLLS